MTPEIVHDREAQDELLRRRSRFGRSRSKSQENIAHKEVFVEPAGAVHGNFNRSSAPIYSGAGQSGPPRNMVNGRLPGRRDTEDDVTSGSTSGIGTVNGGTEGFDDEDEIEDEEEIEGMTGIYILFINVYSL